MLPWNKLLAIRNTKETWIDNSGRCPPVWGFGQEAWWLWLWIQPWSDWSDHYFRWQNIPCHVSGVGSSIDVWIFHRPMILGYPLIIHGNCFKYPGNVQYSQTIIVYKLIRPVSFVRLVALRTYKNYILQVLLITKLEIQSGIENIHYLGLYCGRLSDTACLKRELHQFWAGQLLLTLFSHD